VTGEQLCDALVRAAIDRALRGDFRFWQEIIQRIDGKVPIVLLTQTGHHSPLFLTKQYNQ